MRIRVAAVAAVVVLVAGCGGHSGSAPAGGGERAGTPDTSNVKIDGDASAPVNKIAIQAIADLEQYWGE